MLHIPSFDEYFAVLRSLSGIWRAGFGDGFPPPVCCRMTEVGLSKKHGMPTDATPMQALA
jgi:hypothetical protein